MSDRIVSTMRARVALLVSAAAAGSFGCEPPLEAASPVEEPASPTTTISNEASDRHERIIVGTTCEIGELARCLSRCGSGDALSCNNLGAMAELGRGTTRDLRRAMTLYDSACSEGATAACLNAKRLRASDTSHVPSIVEPTPDDPVATVQPEPAKPDAIAACTGPEDCEKRCHAGDADSCRQLPGIHIQGNVEIHGNVQMFGNVYLYGPNVHIEGKSLTQAQ